LIQIICNTVAAVGGPPILNSGCISRGNRAVSIPQSPVRKMYHTGLLGRLALTGGVLMLCGQRALGRRFMLIWAVGILVIFRCFQPPSRRSHSSASNYIEIFVMPLALLASWFLSQQQRESALLVGRAMVVSGILLSALEQQVVRVVTVNGRSSCRFCGGAWRNARIRAADCSTAERAQTSVARIA
jgi:hypothetical protein